MRGLNFNLEPDEAKYKVFLNSIDFKIDKDFIEFYKNHNGAEGYLNSGSYINLWNIDDMLALNPYYDYVEKCENIYFFGTNGSNLGLAFDKKSGGIISIDFLEISIVEPNFISNKFIDFINHY